MLLYDIGDSSVFEILGILTSSIGESKLTSDSSFVSSERIRGDGMPTECGAEDGSYGKEDILVVLGDPHGLPSLDNTVSGTTRGDEETVNGEEH